MLFFRHVAILSNRAIIFFIKNMFYFTFVLFSKTISLTCFNNFNKTDSEKMNEENVAVTQCQFLVLVIRCHSLSLITRCHSLYHLSFVVTRTTRLSFYKRSY